MMNLILFFLGCICSVALLAFGVYLGKKDKQTAIKWAIGCILIIGIKVFLQYNLDFEIQFLNFTFYSYFRQWWALAPALIILGIAVFQIKRHWLRIVAEVFSGILLLVFIHFLYCQLFSKYDMMKGVQNKKMCCMQSTGYSCGAAASATLLGQYNIVTSEKEMAEKCGTSILGTDEFSAYRGLKNKLNGKNNITLKNGTWIDLNKKNLPAMVVIKLTPVLGHWIVVLSNENNSLQIADPLRGNYKMSKNEFMKKWNNVMIFLQ